MNNTNVTRVTGRRGMALLLVMFIGFASLVLLTTLYSAIAPRSILVRGEAQSDRALTLSDGMIDRLLDQINNTGPYYSAVSSDDQAGASQDLVVQLLLDINGGDPGDSYGTVSSNVRRYFYDSQTDTYYRLESGTADSGTLKNLGSGANVTGGLAGLDANYLTDNRWFELDANAKYWINPGAPDTWEIKATAFSVSKPELKRTIRAEAQRGDVDLDGGSAEYANGNWFTKSTQWVTNTRYFSDYAGLYHSRVYFGQFELTTGMIRSDNDLWMGGWAKDPVSAHGTVNDMAIDDGNDHDGRFGPDAKSLTWAKNPANAINGVKYAADGVPIANWPNGTQALADMNVVAQPGYKYTGNTSIVFSVIGGVGKVSFNGGAPMDLPANGVIYVTGNATVSGTVSGRATVGATGDIFIGGNIIYTKPPRVEKSAAQPPGDPDSLGLIAASDVIIPPATYNANRTLQIDAAMLAINGYFGLDKSLSYSYHPLNSSPHFVGYWNGAQAVYSSSSAPALPSGSTVRGYEEQHTRFDYNLYDFGPPPYFPASDSTTVPVEVTTYPLVTDATLLGTLRGLTRGELTPLISGAEYNAGYRYTFVVGGVTYFYENTFNTVNTYTATYNATKNSLYRVSWKEEIANPVLP